MRRRLTLWLVHLAEQLHEAHCDTCHDGRTVVVTIDGQPQHVWVRVQPLDLYGAGGLITRH